LWQSDICHQYLAQLWGFVVAKADLPRKPEILEQNGVDAIFFVYFARVCKNNQK